MYIEQGFKGLTDGWRYIVGAIIAFMGSQTIGMIPLGIAIFYKMISEKGSIDLSDMNSFYRLYDANIMLVLLLISFVIGLLILFFWVKKGHKQSVTALTTSRKKIDWKRVFFSFLLWGSITLIMTVVDYKMSPENYVWNLEWGRFIVLVILAIVLVPLQTSFEEYFFRGYLMQGIGIAAKNRWVPLVITSLVFGLMHIANPEVAKIGYIIMFYYIGTGFFLGILTLMDEGLELALGFHAANNLVTALLVTANWTAFQTHSVLKDMSEPEAGLDIFIPLLVVYPIILLIFARVYKWTAWKDKLFGPIKMN